MSHQQALDRYIVAKAYTLDDAGNEKPDGFDLLVIRGVDPSPQWCNRFALRRDAIAAKREMEGTAPTAANSR